MRFEKNIHEAKALTTFPSRWEQNYRWFSMIKILLVCDVCSMARCTSTKHRYVVIGHTQWQQWRWRPYFGDRRATGTMSNKKKNRRSKCLLQNMATGYIKRLKVYVIRYNRCFATNILRFEVWCKRKRWFGGKRHQSNELDERKTKPWPINFEPRFTDSVYLLYFRRQTAGERRILNRSWDLSTLYIFQTRKISKRIVIVRLSLFKIHARAAVTWRQATKSLQHAQR